MNKELCFIIENQSLYLEQVLVGWIDIPNLFLCKNDNDEYFLVLCINFEQLNYIVVQISLADVYNLLHGKIPMRDIITSQEIYWEVISGNTVSRDIVTKCDIYELDESVLPEKDAYFEALTDETLEYIEKFDYEIYGGN